MRRVIAVVALVAVVALGAPALAQSSRPAAHHRLGSALCLVKVHGKIRPCRRHHRPHFTG